MWANIEEIAQKHTQIIWVKRKKIIFERHYKFLEVNNIPGIVP